MNKKKLLMFGLPLLALSVIIISAVAIYFATIPVTFSVGEALSTTTIEIDFSGDNVVAGSCFTKQINVSNAANRDLPIQLIWVEISNPNGVTYTNGLPQVKTLVTGDNTINVEFCYEPNSVLGDVSGEIILSRGEGDVIGIAKFIQKNTETWEHIGEKAEITYTVLGPKFIATGIPEGYTLIYYPNTEGDNFATNVENTLVYGIDEFPSLPIAIDVGDNYCNNTFNPTAKVCSGAKLWLIPGNETQAIAKLSSWTEPETYLFETDLITYTKTA